MTERPYTLDQFVSRRIPIERRAEWRRLYGHDNVVVQLLDYVDLLEGVIKIVPADKVPQ